MNNKSTQQHISGVVSILIAGTIIVVLIPSLAFLAIGLAAGMPLGETLIAWVEQFKTTRSNLAVVSFTGAIPVILLVTILGARRLITKSNMELSEMAIGGMLPIAAISLFVNVDYWRVFLPERLVPSFPHGIELVIGPLIFAPVGVLAGTVIAWLVSRQR